MNSRVTIVQVIYNTRQFIEPVFSSIFRQTYRDFHVVAVISGNEDGSKELLEEKFPQVEIIDPGYNIGFSKGHNLVFGRYDSELFQLVNPDLILEPTYVEEIVKAFEDPKVGAATGKLLKIPNDKFQISNEQFNAEKPGFRIIDTTGVIIGRSGRARDRGQHETDRGQYDHQLAVDGVSGAGCMYRRQALLETRLPKEEGRGMKDDKVVFNPQPSTLTFEYFDEDFHSYWEDVDLSWRMKNAGWQNVYVPGAVGYHGRAAGSSKNGYRDVLGFIKHHKQISPRVRQLNFKNHIFMYLKNSPWLYPQFFVRELFMLLYILIFETGTLRVLPEFFRLLPKMWRKRRATIH